jgi:hypothetical protein
MTATSPARNLPERTGHKSKPDRHTTKKTQPEAPALNKENCRSLPFAPIKKSVLNFELHYNDRRRYALFRNTSRQPLRYAPCRAHRYVRCAHIYLS